MDTNFNNPLGPNGQFVRPIYGEIAAITELKDKRLLVAWNYGGSPNLARLSADGRMISAILDQSRANVLPRVGVVNSLEILSSGETLVGGEFTGPFSFALRTNVYIFSLDSNQQPERVFDYYSLPLDGPVMSIHLLDGDSVILGGSFKGSTDFSAVTNFFSSPSLLRLGRYGAIDRTFKSPLIPGSIVRAVAVDDQGTLVIGGGFSLTNSVGQSRKNVVRLNEDTTLDRRFNPGTGPNEEVITVSVDIDGGVFVGGEFTEFNGISRIRLTRLTTRGVLDQNFDLGLGVNGRVNSIIVLSDKSVIVGGEFTSIGGHPRTGIARLIPTPIEVVTPINSPPVIAPIPDKSVAEGESLAFLIDVTDPDGTAQRLTFGLAGDHPTGATVDAATGAFSWIPTEAQGPGSYTITVQVLDNGTPPMSDQKTFTATVNEVNQAPSVASIPDKTRNAGSPLTFTVTVTDADLPPDTLTYTLDPGAPQGATIDPVSGLFSWTPTVAQEGTTNQIAVRVMDNGVPPLSDTKAFTVVVPAQTSVEVRLTAQVLPDGSIRLVWTAASGRTFVLQRSTDLANWEEVTTIQATSSSVEYVDSGTSASTTRFYRVVQR